MPLNYTEILALVRFTILYHWYSSHSININSWIEQHCDGIKEKSLLFDETNIPNHYYMEDRHSIIMVANRLGHSCAIHELVL